MSKKHDPAPAPEPTPPVPECDAELDGLKAQLEDCKTQLSAPAKFGAAPGTVAAFDPASILAIINVVMALIERFRKK
jgi:hypothetical protein